MTRSPVVKDRPRTSPRRAPIGSTKAGSWRLWLLGILVLTFLVYTPSLNNEFTNWDDNYYVTENRLLAYPGFWSILTTPVQGNHHPVTMLSLALDYHLFLLRPAFFHLTSLLIHLANTALTFVFIRRLVGGGIWAPAVTSLLFGIHPMHVESVAWISERKDVVYTLFYLVGLITYLRYFDTKGRLWWVLTLAAFILSVASKPAAVVFPVTLFAVDWYRRRRIDLAAILEKAPHIAVSVAAGLLTLQAQEAAGAVPDRPLWSALEKGMLAAHGLVLYIVKLLAPVGLSAIYPLPDPTARLGPVYYLSVALVVIGLPLAAYLFRRNRSVLFGLMFFLINIALVLQFFPFGVALIADRYTYLPYLGLFFALSYWMDAGPKPSTAGSSLKTIAAGVLLLLVPVSLVQTWKRCDVWQDSGTLWNDVIRKYPNRISLAYYHRGHHSHHVLGQAQAALADYDQALALNPRNGYVWADRGALLAELNRPEEALACLDRALAFQPGLAHAWTNRGAIKGQRCDLAGAVADFTRAIATDPEFRDPYENRAVAYYMLGEHDRSIADARRAIELDPQNPDNHAIRDAIGVSFQAMHRYQEALAEHDAAIRASSSADPRIAGFYLNRSLAWSGLGDRERALRDAQEARRLGAPVSEEYLRKLGG